MEKIVIEIYSRTGTKEERETEVDLNVLWLGFWRTQVGGRNENLLLECHD